MKLIERLFELKKNGTTVRTEIIAGVTTFMTMAYILAVCPNIMAQAGVPSGGVFVATVGAAVAGTLFMAFFANYPFALAPGMGDLAFFTFSVVLGMGYSWQAALLAVFIDGVIFTALSLTLVRESVFNAIPFSLKKALADGIMWGIIGHAGVHIFSGRFREVHWVVYVLAALFIAKYALI